MIRLLSLLLLAACVAGCGCGKTGNSNESSAEGSGNGSSSETESSTLEPSLEAIVEHMMPKGDMTSGASVFVKGDNTMIGVLAEPFDKDYYAIDARLKEMVEEDLKQFNESYQEKQGSSADSSKDKNSSKDALICEGLGLLNGNAVLSLGFTDWNAYAEYMATEVYDGTSVTVKDLKKDDVLEGSFVSVDGSEAETEKILKETKKQKYHIIQVKGEIAIYLERPVVYVSEGAEIMDEYTVKVSGKSAVIITK